MAKLLFDLRDVPDDEADEVRSLLEANSIAFYETRPLAWGLFAGGIWVVDNAIHPQARQLLAAYQRDRAERARAAFAAAQRAGSVSGLWHSIRSEPGKSALLLLAMSFITAIVVLPFLLFGNA